MEPVRAFVFMHYMRLMGGWNIPTDVFDPESWLEGLDLAAWKG